MALSRQRGRRDRQVDMEIKILGTLATMVAATETVVSTMEVVILEDTEDRKVARRRRCRLLLPQLLLPCQRVRERKRVRRRELKRSRTRRPPLSHNQVSCWKEHSRPNFNTGRTKHRPLWYREEVDLFSFDDAPAPAPTPATAGNDDFGSFQSTPTPFPAPVKDDFADFGSLRSAPAAQPDPFVAAQAPPAQQQQQSFDAFGNMAGASGGMNMGGMAMNSPNNSVAGTPGMPGMNNAFGNMTMGTQPAAVPAAPVAAADDEFGDFADAAQPSPVKMNPADPMAKLVFLDHLSKNPSEQKPPATFGQSAGLGQNNQFMQNQQPGTLNDGYPDSFAYHVTHFLYRQRDVTPTCHGIGWWQ
jgi:hypothetical protein